MKIELRLVLRCRGYAAARRTPALVVIGTATWLPCEVIARDQHPVMFSQLFSLTFTNYNVV